PLRASDVVAPAIAVGGNAVFGRRRRTDHGAARAANDAADEGSSDIAGRSRADDGSSGSAETAADQRTVRLAVGLAASQENRARAHNQKSPHVYALTPVVRDQFQVRNEPTVAGSGGLAL